MLGFSSNTRIQSARIAVVCCIGGVHDVNDHAFAITNLALAIARLLQSDRSAHCGETDRASHIDTSK